MVLDEAFEVHDVLNPLLWDKDNRLLPEVKSKILDIVQQFLVMSELDLHIIDITLVGSNASYNYTTTSDLDVHLVVNYEEMNASDELLTVLFNQLRSKFNSSSVNSLYSPFFKDESSSTFPIDTLFKYIT